MTTRTNPARLRARPADHLPAACWCKATTVGVPRRDVLAGLTRSCGAPACDTYDRQHRTPPEEAR